MSGYVSGVSCTVHLPTGVGWSCVAYTKGSYLRSQLGAWEDWLNYKLYYLGNVQMQACAYLRVDTRPSGSTSYQGFITQGLPLGTNC